MNSSTDVQPTNFFDSAVAIRLVLGNSCNESLLPLMLLEINSLRLPSMSCSVCLPMDGAFVLVTPMTGL